MSKNATVERTISRLKQLKRVMIDELYRIIMDHEDIVIKMISESQLYEEGINGLGIDIASYKPYTANTKIIKAFNNQPYDRVTLKDTGYFYSSLYIVIPAEGGFLVQAADPKANDLMKKYGESILRLTEENLRKLLITYVRPELRAAVKRFIQYG